MKNLKKLLNINLNKSETEQYMTQVLSQKFDGELKERYAKILAEKYNVKRAQKQKIKTFSFRAIAASLILLMMVAGTYFFSDFSKDYKALAADYDTSNPYTSNQMTRGGEEDINQTLLQAYSDFDNASFLEAKLKLEALPLTQKSDIFLLAYTQFKTEDFISARKNFKLVLENTADKTYHPEARLYITLSYYTEGKIDQGKTQLEALDKNSWEYKELQKAFK